MMDSFFYTSSKGPQDFVSAIVSHIIWGEKAELPSACKSQRASSRVTLYLGLFKNVLTDIGRAVGCDQLLDAGFYPTGRNIPYLINRVVTIAFPEDNSAFVIVIIVNLHIIAATDHSLDDDVLSNAGQFIKCGQMVFRSKAIAKV